MAGEFDPPLDVLTGPALADLAARLGSITGLTAADRRALLDGAAAALEETVRRKVTRVLVLELNAARISGRLTAADPAARWEQWRRSVAEPAFWRELAGHYPTMPGRLRTVIGNRCEAAALLARRYAADRAVLPTGELTSVEFGAGDSHRGGHAVAVLHGVDGRVVYKPRPLQVDAELARLIPRVLPGEPLIRVPEVIVRDGYGWAEHIRHRHCDGDAELRAFYRGIGHWLALMRLLGGSDLHAENLIAAGPHPVVVDCETLFTPHASAAPSGYGLAVDRAVSLVEGSVLRTGLLPGRGVALGWRGVDLSAVGALPGQQPYMELPVVLGAGTDTARLGVERVPVPQTANHPSPGPVLGRYWDLILAGFDELTERLHAMDGRGELAGALDAFTDCPIRVVLRSTESYAELGRMLWHPAALHDEAAARDKTARLLAEQAGNVPGAPADPTVIAAEVDELCEGDVPFFATTPRRGRMDGPRGTAHGPGQDLVADAVRRWRGRDQALDRQVIQAALVSAYLNEGWLPDEKPLAPALVRTDDLDGRRRTVAAGILRGVLDSAVLAEDGTVTWISPVLNPTGWTVQPLSSDLYGGAHGVAVLLAAYLQEAGQGRADPVDGVAELLAGTLRTIRQIEDRDAEHRREGVRLRPQPPGGYIGVGSQIWGWLLLRRLGAVGREEALTRASALAATVPGSVAADDVYDLVTGMAGAVVPLLGLASQTGDGQWAGQAAAIGVRLAELAQSREPGVCWPSARFPQGLGGLAHGATGIGWALSRLAASPTGAPASGTTAPDAVTPLSGAGTASPTGAPAFGTTALAAFAYEDSLYDPGLGGWRDLREDGITAAAWCHGAGGVGVVAADRLAREGGERWRETLRRAAAACWGEGLGWNHTLCHGDLGAWEVIDLALAAGVGPRGVDRERLDASILGGIEEHGPVSGLARDVFAPGLLPGLGGVAYQLLRMRAGGALPSVLLPDPEG
ncbi:MULTISPECIES: type 2 lanthipeptide synthetase LanM family protein [Streptosporangium]|uniref:Type 2 lantibiotic biosynthesis protein LanM n=1 Tax=Streptosporangium brasiliense TaxID=47480 RepID=A0ABT9R5G1_9ACTN|nr:type 2 lanthipeptide synthetase LanM family protein [Streptosporangium brasiliense]MDP9864479.1 type 2 lantibiotic biosynthesis protein LanM [Streptosporangium brasiliense]